MNMYLKSGLVVLFSMLFCLPIMAQDDGEMTKDEKKALKKEIKYYKKNPDEYKAMIAGFEKKVSNRDEDIVNLKDQLAACKAELKPFQDKLDEIEAELQACEERETEFTIVNESPESKDMVNTPPGLIYKIQIGYYEKFDITDYFMDNNKYVTFEMDGKNIRYTVAWFDDLAEAESFAADVKRMGITDAFVARYIDGERVSIQEAEEYLKAN